MHEALASDRAGATLSREDLVGARPSEHSPGPRVLFCGFRRQFHQEALRSALLSSPPERVGLIARSNFLGDLAHDFVAARSGLRSCTFETLPYRAFPPASLYELLRPSEVVALRMYERSFRGMRSGQAYELRRALWLRHVAWAYGLLVDGGYTRVVFSITPHHPFPFVVHAVAQALGIHVRIFAQIQVKDTYVLGDGIESLFDPIGVEYRRMVRAGEQISRTDLTPRMQVEFDRRTGEHMPYYMKVSDLPWHKQAYQLSKRFFRGDTLLRPHRSLLNSAAYRRARRPAPTEGESFVYFPLHLQPEATTSPMGGVFVDQYLALEMLVRALPEGWKVCVKENPKQSFAKRDRGFYEHIGSLPEVHLVSREAPTFDLIERSRAVATITGTAGWEALFHGKPSIVFGRAFFREAPGVIPVEDLPSLREGLEAISEGRFEVAGIDELQAFLVAVQRTGHEGVVDTGYLRDSDLPEQFSQEAFSGLLRGLLEPVKAAGRGAGRPPGLASPPA